MILTDFRIVLAGLSILLITGCGCMQNGDAATDGEPESVEQYNKYTLTMTIQGYHPHCGGMAPTPEIQANMTRPAGGAIYYMYEGIRPIKKSKFTRIEANSEGIITLELPDGNYGLIQEDKLLSLDEFIALKKMDGIHYQNKPDSCYEDWRSRSDFSVQLSSDTTMLFTVNHKCFTGTNPCLDYSGPYPP
ncbi:MAG: hypothetical protein ACI865_001060 [Flavobacteriaceae bacterium]|jgi:hypothetical protein